MGLQASEMMEDKTQVLAGPWHPAFGHLVLSALVYDQVLEKLGGVQGLFQGDQILLSVHPRFESRLRGDKNRNLEKLTQAYPGTCFMVHTDKTVMPGEVNIRKTTPGG
jgi:hypothetical protein